MSESSGTGRGGRRPGAGRKPKAERFAPKIARAEKRIADRLPELIDNLFVLAQGVRVEMLNPDGEPAVYARPPDYKANSYLIDRILGRPTEAVEVGGPDGRPLPAPVTLVEVNRLESRPMPDDDGGHTPGDARA
jgi:hypothetical protein